MPDLIDFLVEGGDMRFVHKAMRRNNWPLTVVGLFLALLAILMPTPGQTAERLILGHVFDDSTAHHRHMVWAAGEIERALAGRYQLEVIPRGQIGATDRQVIEGFQSGIAHVGYASIGHFVDMFPPLTIGDGPFVFRDFEHWKAFRDSILFKELVEEFESKTGLKVLGLAYYGQRHVTTRQPLTGPDDLKGLVIRVPSIPTILLTFRALGAKPVAIPFKETYQALAEGIVAAQENPLPTIKVMRFHEPTPVINLTAHMCDAQFVLMDGKRWRTIPPQDQAVFESVFSAAVQRVTDDVRSEELALQQELVQLGATLHPIDRAPFIAQMQSLHHSGYFPWSGSLYDRIQALR
jgi:TRAP-type C4-dicarboxylate transport system substrate-binding protein